MTDESEILKLFKEQLKNQINKIVDEEDFSNEGYGFAYWYFRNIAGMTEIDAKDQICDGGGDLGIDAIEIVDDRVLFYQFKNPSTIGKSIATGDIDKLISGLQLILARDHSKIANEELKSRLEEIYAFTPTGYEIITVVSSLGELEQEARQKLDSFCEKNSGAAKNLFSWKFENLAGVHNRFYSANLPTLDATLNLKLERPPYMTQIGSHETYLFDMSGAYLAELFDKHGESILQQNVRMFEGDRGTNIAISQTARSTEDAKDFFHYNNGVSVICDSAVWQPFNNQLSLERPQIVNGGQTIRILHKCFKDGELKEEVHAAVRVITTGKDKEFAASVAINLNNQTRVDNTYLRSNDPRIVQLLHSLSAIGYFLERRAGELDAMLPNELMELEKRYGTPITEHVIPLKDGMQAYATTYFGDPQLAKKDPSKIFTDEGGSFSKILQSGLTADKFRDAYVLSRLVGAQVDKFEKLKRKRYTDQTDRNGTYVKEIGSLLTPVLNELDVAVPQITIFGLAFIFEKYCRNLGLDTQQLIKNIEAKPEMIWECFVELVSSKQALKIDKSWPTILKSGSFYRDAVKYCKDSW